MGDWKLIVDEPNEAGEIHVRVEDENGRILISGFYAEHAADEAAPWLAQLRLITDAPRIKRERDSMHDLLAAPLFEPFLDAVRLEAAHQVDRWGTAHDRGKQPQDWFWLVGYLSGKALRAHIDGDRDKALHHTISSAAALFNWHSAIAGHDTRMQPGHSDVERMVEDGFPGEVDG